MAGTATSPTPATGCEWGAASGTGLDRDRPSRQTAWPGEPSAPLVAETPITSREDEFVSFVLTDVAAREAAEDDFYTDLAHTNLIPNQPD